MALTKHDDYAYLRAKRDPEFARLLRQRAIELLDGDEEDRGIARRILQNQPGSPLTKLRSRPKSSSLKSNEHNNSDQLSSYGIRQVSSYLNKSA